MAQVKLEVKDENLMDVDSTITDAAKSETISTRRRVTRTSARSIPSAKLKTETSDDELALSPSKKKSGGRKVFDGVEVPKMSPTSTPVKTKVCLVGIFVEAERRC